MPLMRRVRRGARAQIADISGYADGMPTFLVAGYRLGAAEQSLVAADAGFTARRRLIRLDVSGDGAIAAPITMIAPFRRQRSR